MYLWTAFTIGILGSLHCVGMCGPIALALPYHSENSRTHLWQGLLYNSGRVLTYSIIGILPGMLGYGLSMAGFQKSTSLILGLALLLSALISLGFTHMHLQVKTLTNINNWVRHNLGTLLRRQQNTAFFSIGMINGLLPCGLVYMALAGALTQDSALAGSAYMMLFGLGTIPLMLSVSLSKLLLSVKTRNSLRRIVPIFMMLVGTLLIFRGLNVSLPGHLGTIVEMGIMPMCH
ncbi:MAG: sulfite exporter TauE/SafE family protein [Saprospiraceae bacterium]|nr:sulfite exporter TauE/SafE family protein [Saprospiraceae bacterium]